MNRQWTAEERGEQRRSRLKQAAGHIEELERKFLGRKPQQGRRDACAGAHGATWDEVGMLLQRLAAAEAEARRAQDDAADTGYDNLQHVSRIDRLLGRIYLGEVKRQRLREEKRQLKADKAAADAALAKEKARTADLELQLQTAATSSGAAEADKAAADAALAQKAAHCADLERQLQAAATSSASAEADKAAAVAALAEKAAHCAELERQVQAAQAQATASAAAQVEAVERVSAVKDEEVGGLRAALHESQAAQQVLSLQVHLLRQRIAATPALRTIPLEPLLGGLGVAVAAGAQGVVSTGTLAWALKLGTTPATQLEIGREGTVMAGFQHPHITTVLAWVRSLDGTQSGLLMPRALHALSAVVERQAGICTGMRLRLLMGSHACAGLSAMHARGWAHYDIKPANILVFMEGGLEVGKLCDLGAAREFDATMGLADTGGNLLGTAAYLFPNLLEFPGLAVSADVWSMLVTVHDLLAPTTAFADLSAEIADIRANPSRGEDLKRLAVLASHWPAAQWGACGLGEVIMLAQRFGLASIKPLCLGTLAAEPWERPALAPLVELVNRGLTLANWAAARPCALADIASCLAGALAELPLAAPAAAPPAAAPAPVPGPAQALAAPTAAAASTGHEVEGASAGAAATPPTLAGATRVAATVALMLVDGVADLSGALAMVPFRAAWSTARLVAAVATSPVHAASRFSRLFAAC